jgi:hypothetical protein
VLCSDDDQSHSRCISKFAFSVSEGETDLQLLTARFFMYDVLKLWELEDMSQKRDALFNGCNNISRHGGKGKHPGVGLARIGGANGTIDSVDRDAISAAMKSESIAPRRAKACIWAPKGKFLHLFYVKTGKMEREIAYRKYGIPSFCWGMVNTWLLF